MSTALENAQVAPAGRSGGETRSSRASARSGKLSSTGSNAAISPAPATKSRSASDDEILGLGDDQVARPQPGDQTEFDWDSPLEGEPNRASGEEETAVGETAEPSQLQAALESNPELRHAWEDAKAYKETFATPEQAQAASVLVADLRAMDALFFSGRREDHATLAQKIATLDPVAFKSLAQAMGEIAAGTVGRAAQTDYSARDTSGSEPVALRRTASVGEEHHDQTAARASTASDLAGASPEFLQAANAAAVESVLGAIKSQVQRLLPEEVPTAARNRVVGEIYRELDRSLGANREFARQMREAVASGSRDAEHQQAIVSLVTGRARQALPAIAKKVLNEWTSTIVAANHERRARQRVAERRVDIVGSGRSGSDGHRTMTPHDIDYARMSDADILNL